MARHPLSPLVLRPLAHPRDIHYPAFTTLADRLRPEILVHGYTRGDATWRYLHKATPFNRLYLFLKGEAWVARGGKGHAVSARPPGTGWVKMVPGQAYLLPSGEDWHLWADRPFEKFFIGFRFEIWPGRDVFSRLPAPLPLVRPQAHRSPWWTWAAGGPLELLKLHSAFFTMLVEFLATAQAGAGTGALPGLGPDLALTQKYSLIVEAADTTPFRAWSPKSLAAAMGRSLPSLSRSFHRDSGVTLGQFFSRSICRRAGSRLALTDEPIRLIADELGFDDENYFNRLFKKTTGYAPGVWRETFGKADGSRRGEGPVKTRLLK